MRKKWMRSVFSRRVIVVFLLVFQMGALFALLQSGIERFAFLSPFLEVLSAVTVLYIISRQDTAAYKLTWTVLILIAPVLGGLFYRLYRMQASTHRLLWRRGEIAKA